MPISMIGPVTIATNGRPWFEVNTPRCVSILLTFAHKPCIRLPLTPSFVSLAQTLHAHGFSIRFIGSSDWIRYWEAIDTQSLLQLLYSTAILIEVDSYINPVDLYQLLLQEGSIWLWP